MFRYRKLKRNNNKNPLSHGANHDKIYRDLNIEKFVGNRRLTNGGWWSMVSDPESVIDNQWSMIDERWSLVHVQRSID